MTEENSEPTEEQKKPAEEQSEPSKDKAKARADRSRAAKIGGWALEFLIVVVGAIVISSLLRTFVAQMFIIPSGSMENTLTLSDRVVVSKIGNFQRGDIVVFEDPGKWLPGVTEQRSAVGSALEFIGLLPNSSTNHLIKRVIGMPGDHVECCDATGKLKINGKPIDESEYLFSDANGVMVAPANVPFDVVVPRDRIFVMGDHRNASGDSRCHLHDSLPGEGPGSAAFIPINKVVGATVALAAPLSRIRTFSVPAAFSGVPPPASPAPEAPVLNVVNPGC